MRFLAITLAFCVVVFGAGHSPLHAQSGADGVPVGSVEEVAEDAQMQSAREEIAKLERENLIFEAKEEINKGSYARLEILLAAFAALMTGVVLFFAITTKNEAIAEAKKEARKEAGEEARKEAKLAVQESKTEFASLIEQTKTELDGLTKEARESAEASKQSLAKSNRRANEIESLLGSMRVKGEAADETLSKLESALEFVETRTGAVTTGAEEKKATQEEKRKLDEAVAETQSESQDTWSVDQFKLAIGKARFSDEDWREVADLSRDMLEKHHSDTSAKVFALQSLGKAEIEGRNWDAAKTALIRALSLLEEGAGGDDVEQALTEATLAQILNELGDYSESEKKAQRAWPKLAEYYGPSDRATLVTRHWLARAFLERREYSKAEKEVREIIDRGGNQDFVSDPWWNVVWDDLSRVLMARGELDQAVEINARLLEESVCDAEMESLARYHYQLRSAQIALLQQDARAASSVIADIPDLALNEDWRPRHSARLAYVRGQTADALEKTDEATQYLSEALKIYESIAPVAAYELAELKEYLRSRDA